MNNKILTIAIAAYNVQNYLVTALESCLLESELRDKIEVIIVNDGSTDDTLKIAKEYESKYPEVYKVVDKENGGYGSTINYAINIANGKYFRILDGDDWLDKDALKTFVCNSESYNADVIFYNYDRVYMSEEQVVRTQEMLVGQLKENVTYNFSAEYKINWSMHMMIVLTDMLKRYNVKLLEKCFYTDGEYVFYVMSHMKTFQYVNESMYMYQIGRQGQSVSYQGRIKHKEDSLRVLKKELDYFENVNYENEFVKRSVLRHLVNTATGVIEYYLLSPCNKENRKKIYDIDIWLKNSYIDVFEGMNKKKPIWLLRVSKYSLYRICQWNEIRKIYLKKV